MTRLRVEIAAEWRIGRRAGAWSCVRHDQLPAAFEEATPRQLADCRVDDTRVVVVNLYPPVDDATLAELAATVIRSFDRALVAMVRTAHHGRIEVDALDPDGRIAAAVAVWNYSWGWDESDAIEVVAPDARAVVRVRFEDGSHRADVDTRLGA